MTSLNPHHPLRMCSLPHSHCERGGVMELQGKLSPSCHTSWLSVCGVLSDVVGSFLHFPPTLFSTLGVNHFANMRHKI